MKNFIRPGAAAGLTIILSGCVIDPNVRRSSLHGWNMPPGRRTFLNSAEELLYWRKQLIPGRSIG